MPIEEQNITARLKSRFRNEHFKYLPDKIFLHLLLKKTGMRSLCDILPSFTGHRYTRISTFAQPAMAPGLMENYRAVIGDVEKKADGLADYRFRKMAKSDKFKWVFTSWVQLKKKKGDENSGNDSNSSNQSIFLFTKNK